jgi:hypothetical protein
MELLLEVELRNPRRVFRDGNSLLVEQTDPHGTKHTDTIPIQLAESLRDALRGQTVNAEEAAEVLRRLDHDDCPYHYGHKLRYFAQEVLISLVALEKAEFWKEGRKYFYCVFG